MAARAIVLMTLLAAIAGCRETHHCDGIDNSFQNGECRPRPDRDGSGVDGGSDTGGVNGGHDGGPCDLCLSTEVCSTSGDASFDSGPDECVMCVEDTDCDTDLLPWPDGGGADGGVPGIGLCENFLCVWGCRGDGECAGNACVANRCTNYPRGMQGQCERCDAEENCDATTDCVPMTFGPAMTRIGSYCLAVVPTTGPCPSPYTFSVDSGGHSYCGVNEALTTCDAVLAFGTRIGCAAGTETGCGRDDLSGDGICTAISGLGTACTYRCTPPDSTTCPGRTCGTVSNLCGGS